jgi:hypothetical protein
MICKECFFYDLRSQVCAERYNLPAEEEKCYFFEPQVKVFLNQAEIRAIIHMFMDMKDREYLSLTSLYEKIRKVTSPTAKVYKQKPQDCIPSHSSHVD